MQSAQRAPVPWTTEEYLAREERSPIKNELIGGQIYAMAGSSREHDTIAGNAYVALRSLIGRRACQAFTGDMRIHVPATGLFTYSDGLVVCGKPEFLVRRTRGSTDTLLNPMLIVEVLSPSTEEYDRGEKFSHYRSVPSLKEVLFISQDQRLVEHHRRTESGRWVRGEVREGAVEVPALGGELSLDDLYEHVELPGEPMRRIAQTPGRIRARPPARARRR